LQKPTQTDRRTFLKLSGAGLAVLASHSAWADIASTGLPTRRSPTAPVILRSSQLEVVIDGKDALPYEYRLHPSGARMRGEDFGKSIQAVICNRERWEFSGLPVVAASVDATRNQADFRLQVADGTKPAAGFVLRYRIDGATVHITLEDIQESQGYEFIQLVLPCLVTVREEDGNAWLAHGDTGGSLAFLKEAAPGHLAPNRFWGNVAATLPVVMLGTDRAMCVQEVTAFMDGTELSVIGADGYRRGCMGTTQTHRVNGSLCYDMNTGTSDTLACGNRQTPNLLVEQNPSCRLDFIATSTESLDWMDGAELVRDRMPKIPTQYYDSKLIYGIRCDEPRFEKPGATFAQCEELIHTISALTGNWPQVVHLWGWQYRGKDTGYPAVAEVNKRLGTYDDLMQLMENARKYNCTVTFSDNYDDAYKSSPAWDPNYIARRPDGELWESRNWTGENSYIMGLAKYMKGPGVERVRYTCEHYKLRETTHVDVLAYYPIRNDWDPAEPASGIKNLFDGRYKVLQEFAKYGVDVSSEALRYAFLGKISYFWNMAEPTACPFDGKPIPLVSTIYRHSAIWGEGARNRSNAERILSMLFYNACQHPYTGTNSQYGDITDIFYLMMVPWFKVYNRKMESFRREGERTVIGLEGNAQIDLDWQNKNYKVNLDGVEVARTGSITCPLGSDRIAFYRIQAGDLSIPLPKGWRAEEISARLLTSEAPQAINAIVDSGVIKISVPPRQPVIVYRSAAGAAAE
jgi:Endo-alpha-N-acetylgalactosaminidase